MRSVIMKGLTAGMALAALLAFGVAKAGEHAPVDLPPGYRVVQEDAHIRGSDQFNGYEVIDNDTILLRTALSGLYLADLSGRCGQAARFDWTIAVDSRGGGDITRSSHLLVNGRRCVIAALTKVERTDAPAH